MIEKTKTIFSDGIELPNLASRSNIITIKPKKRAEIEIILSIRGSK
jgi:hypothetical protein